MDLSVLLERAPAGIRERFRYRSYGKNEIILNPGEENEFLYILTGGSAEVIWQNYAGEPARIYQFEPYSCFGDNELFNKKLKTLSIVAKKKSEVIIVGRAAVYAWMKADFDFTLYIIEQMADKLINSSEKTLRLSFMSLKERILYSVYTHCQLNDLEGLSKNTLTVEVSAPIRSVNRVVRDCIAEELFTYEKKAFGSVAVERIGEILEEYIGA